MTTEVATQDLPVVINRERPMTVAEVTAQSLIIHQILEHVMVEGVHYGSIPGTGDKKTLLQPGAEKICTTFRLAPKPHVEDLSEPRENFYRYRVTCSIYTIHDSVFVGAACGEASSLEEKYSWEAAICHEQYELADPLQRRIKFKKDTSEKGYYTIEQIARNAPDLANTVLKMAVKRAFISATRGATAASDLLEVDLEEEAVADVARQERAEQPKPKAKRPAPRVPYGEHKGKEITDTTIPLGMLQWMANKTKAQLEDPKRSKFQAQDKLFLAALEAEIKARAETPPKEEPKQPQEPAQAAPEPTQATPPDSTAKPPIDDSAWADLILYCEEEVPEAYKVVKETFQITSGHDLPKEKRRDFLEAVNAAVLELKNKK